MAVDPKDTPSFRGGGIAERFVRAGQVVPEETQDGRLQRPRNNYPSRGSAATG
jgi:hypothetical protein